jgi:hypothetical protein
MEVGKSWSEVKKMELTGSSGSVSQISHAREAATGIRLGKLIKKQY